MLGHKKTKVTFELKGASTVSNDSMERKKVKLNNPDYSKKIENSLENWTA